jgi:TonB-linked SusC/RagA family outer membrane protein
MRKKQSYALLKMRLSILTLALLICQLTFAQQKISVRGQVVDQSNEPIVGAVVKESGGTNGAVTDMDGNFSINVKGGATLSVSYVGFAPASLKPSAKMHIVLQENNKLLDEVLVIGYGTSKRKDVTTSVSSVSTKDIDSRPIISAGQAIQGKAAGITVMQPNGLPGSGLSIRVRGTTSFNGSNDPLYVVDGVPMTDIDFLSANDIESIQILKDASSAAIYGSRAANGVIMITTKQGEKGKSKISFNGYIGMTKVNNKIHALNASQYKSLMDEIGLVSLPDGLTDQTDWFDETYQTGVTQNYQASITNATDKIKYYLSGGYTDETGVIKTAYYKRYNFKANVSNQIRSWLNVSANLAYSDYQSNGIISGTGANRGGVILSVINTPTYAPVWDATNPQQYNTNFYGVNITSPLENMARSQNNKSESNRLIATGKADITFMPDLKFNSSFTLDRAYTNSTSFLDPVTTSWGRNQMGEGSDNRSLNTLLVFDNILSYSHKFGKNSIDAMAGTSWTKSMWSQSYINGSHYNGDAIQTLNAANKISWSGTGSSAADWAIMSYVARLSYNYDSKYMITANMRADGSSKLAPGQRWGYFPSVSAAWRISSEKFMKNITWIDDLKLRGGWGQTGNQSGLGDYSYLQRYSINRMDWTDPKYADAVPSIKQSSLRNHELTWETTSQTNIGLDLTVLKNRLTFYADYYYKKTTNMLMNVTLPTGAAAASSIARNEGEMTNKGFEFAVESRNITGPFEWTTNANISFNKNKLTKLELTNVYYDAKTCETVNDYAVRNEVGRSLGGFYGYISDGVDPETGELMYRDINGDGKISTSDRTYIGDPNPDFTYGITNTFAYKGITLNILLQGSYGNDIYNASRMETEGMYDGKNQSTVVLDRWQVPGQITSVPKAGFRMFNSSYFVENGSYLRVKDITLSYSLPSRLLSKFGITKLQPYFTATNLITFTKYNGMDPEVNQWGNSGSVQGIDWGTYPQSKSFVFGLNVEF